MTMLGQRLRDLRRAAGLSQGQLATYAGVSQSTLSDLERGEIAPKTLEAIIRLARYHKTTTDYLLGLIEDNAEETNLAPALDETIQQLIKTIRNLTKHRQRDLLAMAEMFLARKEKDDTLAWDTVLNRVREVGGIEAEELAYQLLNRFGPAGTLGDSSGVTKD